MSDLDQIDDFLALERLRSFSKAAEARHVSQPAFTRRIRQLEADTGAPLFDRTSKPIGLTQAGLRFLTYARNLSHTFQQALAETRAAWSQMQDPVRIATTHTLAITLFPSFWKECLRTQSNLKVILSGQRTENCLRDLQEGNADMALVHAPHDQREKIDTQNTESLKIASDYLVAVTAPFARNAPHKWLAYTPEIQLAQLIDQNLTAKQKAQADVVFESPSSEVLKAMAMAGHGLAYMPERLIEDERRDGYLVHPTIKLPRIPMDILLIRQKNVLNQDIDSIWHTAQKVNF